MGGVRAGACQWACPVSMGACSPGVMSTTEPPLTSARVPPLLQEKAKFNSLAEKFERELSEVQALLYEEGQNRVKLQMEVDARESEAEQLRQKVALNNSDAGSVSSYSEVDGAGGDDPVIGERGPTLSHIVPHRPAPPSYSKVDGAGGDEPVIGERGRDPHCPASHCHWYPTFPPISL